MVSNSKWVTTININENLMVYSLNIDFSWVRNQVWIPSTSSLGWIRNILSPGLPIKAMQEDKWINLLWFRNPTKFIALIQQNDVYLNKCSETQITNNFCVDPSNNNKDDKKVFFIFLYIFLNRRDKHELWHLEADFLTHPWISTS